MSYRLEVVDKSDVEKSLNVEVDAEIISKKVDKKILDFQKKAKVKGFREGKVPLELIKSQYLGVITEEVLKEEVNSSLLEIIQEKFPKMVGLPKIISSDYSGNLKFTAEIELFPQVNVELDEQYEIEIEHEEVSDEIVLKTIEIYAESLAKFEKSDKQIIEDKDIVLADITRDGDKRDNQKIDLAGVIFPQLKDKLIGSKVNDTFTVEINHNEKKEAIDGFTLEVLVKEIQNKIKPEFTDEYVKGLDIPNIETYQQYFEYVKNNLIKESQNSKDNKICNAIVVKISDKSLFTIPQIMIDHQIKTNFVNNKWMTFEQAKSLDISPFRQMYQKESEQQVRIALIVDKIGEEQRFSVTPEEFHEALHKDMETYGVDHETMDRYFENPENKTNRENVIIREKVLDFLKARTKVTIKQKEEK